MGLEKWPVVKVNGGPFLKVVNFDCNYKTVKLFRELAEKKT